MQGGDRDGVAETQLGEGPGVNLPVGVVDLVDDHDHGLVGAPEDGGHGGVLVGGTDHAVGHQDHHVGLLDGPFRLPAHLAGQGLVGAEPPAGVDHQEAAPAPLGLDGLAVAGDTGLLLDDRLAAAEDPVEEGRLAHVGTADDGDGGKSRPGSGHGWARSASTSAWPSVATTSTGRGRSAGAVPSRNRSLDRVTSGST